MLTLYYWQLALIIFLTLSFSALLVVFTLRIKKSYKEHKAINALIFDIAEEDAFMIWQCIYTEASESLRDHAKNMVLVSVGAIGFAAVLLSMVNTPYNKNLLLGTLVVLALNLFFSLYAGVVLADQRKDDLSSLHKAIASKDQKNIEIPHIWPNFRRFLVFNIPLLTLGLSLALCCITIIANLSKQDPEPIQQPMTIEANKDKLEQQSESKGSLSGDNEKPRIRRAHKTN